MGDKLILLAGIIYAAILFQMFTRIIAGHIYDDHKKNVHFTHDAFMLYGILSFFKEIRHKYICNKCF